MSVRFIAEVSSNHRQDLARSLAFIDAAAAAGCDGVKFQLFRIDRLFAPEILARSARHRARRDWELPVEFLASIAERCRARGVEFWCTPFDLEAVEALRPFVAGYKVASYELLWLPLISACAATGLPLTLSTGMATLDEVRAAVAAARAAGAESLELLHCVSAYPAPPAQANLAAIETLRAATGCPSGWSDHTVSAGVIHRAVHRFRASTIEFHLDLDGLGAEAATGHCWRPETIAPVIAAVREGLEADGDGVKGPTAAELSDRDWRADPHDGLRPLRHLRGEFRG